MPLIRYVCQDEKCGAQSSAFFKSAKLIEEVQKCKKCGYNSKRVLSAPTASSKMVIDNGTQARAVETYSDIMELREDWSKPPNRGD